MKHFPYSAPNINFVAMMRRYSLLGVSTIFRVIAVLLFITNVTLLIVHASGFEQTSVVASYVVPVDLLFVVFAVFRTLPGIRAYKAERRAGNLIYDAIRSGVEKVFPGGNRYLIHELSMYKYAFFAWKDKAPSHSAAPAFTYHKKSNMLVLLIFLGFVLTLEGFGVHLLISQWSVTAAWIVSAGNLYLLLLFLADYRAMILNPVTIENGNVVLRYGLRAFINIPMHTIVSITVSRELEIPKADKKEALTPVLDSPNCLIECSEPMNAVLMFGIKRSSKKLYLAIDEPAKFKETVLSQR